MTWFLTGIIAGLILGFILGAYMIYRFNPTDYKIAGKYRAKKGSRIDISNDLSLKEKDRLIDRLFNKKNKI